MMRGHWLHYTFLTAACWGIWGAVTEFPAKFGFPATLGYTTWAMIMIPCATIVLALGKWKLDYDLKSILFGSFAGLLGAGGQLILFCALRQGPAHIIFPVIALYPALTVVLSSMILHEKAGGSVRAGVVAALVAIPLLSYQKSGVMTDSGYTWLILAVLILAMWGIQAFLIKLSHKSMRPESIFFYMMTSSVMLVPVAICMTDFSADINWGFKGQVLAAGIQVLNVAGALFLVFALRDGKAIVVTPITALAPVITIILSLILYAVVPHMIVIAGMVLAVISIRLLAYGPSED